MFMTSRHRGAHSEARGSNSVVECQLPKLDVAGSTPVSRSIFPDRLPEKWLVCAETAYFQGESRIPSRVTDY